MHGKKRSEETKKRISDTLTGREFDEETLHRMADSHRGNAIPDEVRKRISHSLSGFERPPETRQKMSEARRGEKKPRYRDSESGTYGLGWTAARRKVNARENSVNGVVERDRKHGSMFTISSQSLASDRSRT